MSPKQKSVFLLIFIMIIMKYKKERRMTNLIHDIEEIKKVTLSDIIPLTMDIT